MMITNDVLPKLLEYAKKYSVILNGGQYQSINEDESYKMVTSKYFTNHVANDPLNLCLGYIQVPARFNKYIKATVRASEIGAEDILDATLYIIEDAVQQYYALYFYLQDKEAHFKGYSKGPYVSNEDLMETWFNRSVIFDIDVGGAYRKFPKCLDHLSIEQKYELITIKRCIETSINILKLTLSKTD